MQQILKNKELLPPAYGVRREGYVLTRVCLSVHRGGGGSVSRLSRGGGQVQPGGGGGSLHGGRYASCVHAGGLSCTNYVVTQ